MEASGADVPLVTLETLQADRDWLVSGSCHAMLASDGILNFYLTSYPPIFFSQAASKNPMIKLDVISVDSFIHLFIRSKTLRPCHSQRDNTN